MSVMVLCALVGPALYLAGCSGGGSAVSAGGAVVSSVANTSASSPVQTLALGQAISNDPGPNAAYAATQPFYKCVTNYYLSTSGSDSNDGRSPLTSWLTIAHAGAQALGGGSCVNMSPGIYLQPSTALINNGGNSASQIGYTVYRCTALPYRFVGGALQGEGSGCVVRASPSFAGLPNLVGENASYVAFDGIEFDGNNNTVSQCMYVPSRTTSAPHHLVILNSDVHGCGLGFGAGIDWLWVVHSVWHDTASGSAEGSGFSNFEPTMLSNYVPTAADNAWCSTTPVSACYHVVVAYNVGYNNYDEQGSTGNHNTDGDGVLLDTWKQNNFTAPALVMGNVIYNNGGFGIGCYKGAQGGVEVFANNSIYGDGWDPNANYSRNELFSGNCYNAVFINNIAYGVAGGNIPTTGDTSIAAWGSGNATFGNNIAYGTPISMAAGYSFPLSGTNQNLIADPLYTAVSYRSNINNFALRPGSPALGFGQSFSLWNQSGIVDAGACPRTLTNCP